MHPFREPSFPKVAMRRDSVWSVVAVAGIVAILSASIPLGLEYFESRAHPPPLVHHPSSPKLLASSGTDATLFGGIVPYRPPPPFVSASGDHFMMLHGCIGQPLDHDPRGEPGIRCSKDEPHRFMCWDVNAPGGLGLAPRL